MIPKHFLANFDKICTHKTPNQSKNYNTFKSWDTVNCSCGGHYASTVIIKYINKQQVVTQASNSLLIA